LSSAFSAKVTPVSLTSGISGYASAPTRSNIEPAVGEDRAEFGDLVGVAGGEYEAAGHGGNYLQVPVDVPPVAHPDDEDDELSVVDPDRRIRKVADPQR